MNSTLTDQLLKLGILTMSVAGHDDVPMSALVKRLIADPGLNITKMLGPSMKAAGADVDPALAMFVLNGYLGTVEHGSCRSLLVQWPLGFSVFAGACMAARFACRRWLTGGVRRDDWAMLGAWILTAGFMATMLSGAVEGIACRHIWDLSYNKWKRNYLRVWISEILYPIANLGIKLALLVFFADLAPTLKTFRRWCIAVGAAVTASSIATVLFFVFQCRPVNFWDAPLAAKCVSQVPWMIATGVLTIVGDAVVLILPIPMIVNSIRLRRKEKAVVIGMFATGGFACVAACVRLYYCTKFPTDPDMPYKECAAGFWAQLELDLAIVISCIPAFRSIAKSVSASHTNTTVSYADRYTRRNPSSFVKRIQHRIRVREGISTMESRFMTGRTETTLVGDIKEEDIGMAVFDRFYDPEFQIGTPEGGGSRRVSEAIASAL